MVSIISNKQNVEPVERAQVEADVRRRIRNSLVALQRKALSNMEEKGIETLHLAIGLATWPSADGGRPYNAPVLLWPARIETRNRRGSENDLQLFVSGEPQINPVLLYVLEENYAVRIDALAALSKCGSEDETGQWRMNSECLFEYIKQVAASVRGFEVIQRSILANFQFAKMAMVEDLKKNGDSIISSLIVAAVAGHLPSRQLLAQSVSDFDTTQIDQLPASDDYLVLDADSSQQRVIVLVSKGQSGVIQGPPGTGKSQTIANLIVQNVAQGRSVLFVAEKRAALEAVIKRLSHPNVRLGHLALDLHGASVSRREVMGRLADALEQIRYAMPANDARAVFRNFESCRNRLNEHARRVNQPRQPTGLSVYQMIGKLLRFPEASKSSLRFRGETLTALTEERLDEVKQWILEGASNPALFLGSDSSAWNNADIKDGTSAQEALDMAIHAAEELYPRFMGLLERVVSQLGIRRLNTLEDVDSFLSVLHDFRTIRQHFAAEIFTLQLGDLANALKPATRSLIAKAWAFLTKPAYRAARKQLLSIRVAPASVDLLLQETLQADHVLRRWRGFNPASPEPLEVDAIQDLAAVFEALYEITKKLESITETGSFSGMALEEAGVRLQKLANDRITPFRLPEVHSLRSRLKAAGLTSLLDDFRENDVLPENWLKRLEYIWLSSALEQALASDPGLASFNGRTHEQIVADFIRLDQERIQYAATRVRRLHAEQAIAAMNQHPDQTDLVRREVTKKSRHIPLRDLLARAPDVLTRIAPCWVASPLSVSQLLDGSKRHFDVVIFDEASQILQEDAIPALYRAEQVVVAGDRHQLPPTTFFATAIEGEDDIESGGNDVHNPDVAAGAAIGGFESLLDTLETFLPNWLLEWHYRSEDERLITFSNNNIYNRRLVTFPTARENEAIKHILVKHDFALAGQEESASREVEEVVRQVLYHAQTRQNESLGVITMGIKHANRVQAALDRALENRQDLWEFFSLEREERFFVKNLETVQGDERDAIILSIGYGKSANGDLPHRFGPLTQDVGYRRLNVAITRARRRMLVISSFSHEEIDLSRAGSRGVQLLKSYLKYAADGGQRFPEDERVGEVSLNPFEADVRDALESRSIKTRPQYGASRYRIDLAAMHPSKPGVPVLAIECDGASYHSSPTARDRDRLRQAHLQKLGWRFHRIWSTDWFYKREQEIERAVSAYQEAVRLADMREAGGQTVFHPDGFRPSPQKQRQQNERQRAPCPRLPARGSIDHYTNRELIQIAEWIQSDGLLRTDDELINEIFQELPFKRMGIRIRKRLQDIVRLVSRT